MVIIKRVGHDMSYIRIPLVDFITTCPHCKKTNDHRTGEVCEHLSKVTAKHIAFYFGDADKKKTAKTDPLKIKKDKRLTVCSVCDEVYDKNITEQKYNGAKVCSEPCLQKKEEKNENK
jgi:hypothetical protein